MEGVLFLREGKAWRCWGEQGRRDRHAKGAVGLQGPCLTLWNELCHLEGSSVLVCTECA